MALLIGPLAFASILKFESQRSTSSQWPHVASVVFALPAVWGVSCWIMLFAVFLFGNGMTRTAFMLLQMLALAIAAAALTAGYVRIVRRRKGSI